MKTAKTAHQVFLTIFSAALWCLSSANANAAAPPKLPGWEEISAYVDRHFANITDYRPDDIISTSHVEPLLEGLQQIGWHVPQPRTILDRVPGDSEFVVRQLRTEPGRKFMEQIKKYPLAYDRLYHLSVIPRGRQQVYDLIRAKDGYKMIEYMTTSDQGKNLGTMLSKVPDGAGFNKPVGKLFTATALKEALQKKYEETLAASVAK